MTENLKKTTRNPTRRSPCLGACGRYVDLGRRVVRKGTYAGKTGYCRKCQRRRELAEIKAKKRAERAAHPKPYRRIPVWQPEFVGVDLYPGAVAHVNLDKATPELPEALRDLMVKAEERFARNQP